MKSPDLSPRSKIVATATALALSVSALAGCGDKPEGQRSCYAMPYGHYSDEVSQLIKENHSKYENVTNRIAAAMIVNLGIDKTKITKDFSGWNKASKLTRDTLYEKHKLNGNEMSPSDLPKDTDYIAFEIKQNSATNLKDGGKIYGFPDGIMAFENPDQLNSYIHNTGGFNQISCYDAEPITAYPE